MNFFCLLDCLGCLQSLHSDVADVMMANYLWLSAGGKLQVLDKGAYHHRVDPSSFYLRTATASRARVMELFDRFAAGQRWDEAYARECLRCQGAVGAEP